ncbi:hypothetical protein J2X63_000159 [Agromyces sp. 3263]|uniref:hypothetical protein n=1 Tax=Agromyces sp. 3263 TaxID=2817750 RepID=UPI0028671B8F|nr:hypothetical protein [Agromyces sp. 3263]MDR6904473.1 hypothetical protein [Agromyces sp. 3263]
MSGDGTEYEYPDEAGYPDGTGTLHEGVEDADGVEGPDDAATAAGDDLETFAMEDEEDVDGD